MKLEHLWLASPLPAVREATTVYADRLPLGNLLPLKMLKHSIGVESRSAEPASPSLPESTSTMLLTLPGGHLQNKQCLLPVAHQSLGLVHHV